MGVPADFRCERDLVFVPLWLEVALDQNRRQSGVWGWDEDGSSSAPAAPETANDPGDGSEAVQDDLSGQ